MDLTAGRAAGRKMGGRPLPRRHPVPPPAMTTLTLDDDLLARLHDVPVGEPVTFVSESDPADHFTVYVTPLPRPPREPDVRVRGGSDAEPRG